MPVSISVKGIASEFRKAREQVNKEVNQQQRITAFRALEDLKRTTPIDTGRAQQSWLLTKDRFKIKDRINGAVSSALGPTSVKEVERLYFTNGTPYIEVLNRGTSLQAAPRFIEQTLGKYFRSVKGSSIRTT